MSHAPITAFASRKASVPYKSDFRPFIRNMANSLAYVVINAYEERLGRRDILPLPLDISKRIRRVCPDVCYA